ncbi:unnamed protein product [Danaus chrysippus]|uniref:(African queen) hypothetical protein n=1 Tax=Danaus chrysippus TaxID=151541 RepID=A0A8J2RDX8_9NEOP|nr:unnamed protein product [Danaus chrysippus]
MADNIQEQQVKRVKRFLESWRMALLPLKSVLIWEQQWHPCAILAFISILFLTISLMDLSTLATISVVGLIFNFIDFIVPIMCNTICSPGSWTGQNEKMYEDICRSIVITYNKIITNIKSFYALRETSPPMYYLISISMLSVTTWMAASINNVFLLYIFFTIVLLWPGIQHRGILNTVLSFVNKAPKMASLKSD